MAKIRLLLSRHSLIAGLVLMFALTWPIDLAQADLLPIEVPFAVYLFLGWGFIIASLIMTGLTQGRAGVVALLKRFLIWRVGWRWYGIALGVYPALFLAALGLNAARTGAPIEFSETLAAQFFGLSAALPLFVAPFFLFEAVANGEELGWRGYVLPRVQARHGALLSALIVGIIWGLWHLPKYLYPFDVIAFTMVMVKATGDSVLYTWLNNNTRGSLLLAVVFHATSNTAGFFLLPAPGVPGREPLMGLIVVLVVLAAAAVVVRYGPQQLSRTNNTRMSLVDADDARRSTL
jgi:membrane protease YdiL (CAAX protease family)